MEKLRLKLDQLEVESFAVVRDGAGRRGTVEARDSGATQLYHISCMGYCGPSVEQACETTNDPILDCLCTGDC